MNEFLHTNTWMAHMDFWWCLKMTMMLLIGGIGVATLLWCLLVVASSVITAHQERNMRRRRKRDYRVGAVCTPEVTRAWLAAMRDPQRSKS